MRPTAPPARRQDGTDRTLTPILPYACSVAGGAIAQPPEIALSDDRHSLLLVSAHGLEDARKGRLVDALPSKKNGANLARRQAQGLLKNGVAKRPLNAQLDHHLEKERDSHFVLQG